jgi:hypothetical protein
MTLHAFLEYIKYRWKARGRHGTHSPFVYAFVEDALQDRKRIELKELVEFPGLSERYILLLNKITAYYNLGKLKWLPDEDDTQDSFDALMLSPDKPLQWEALANKYFPILESDNVVFVLGIHKSVQHTRVWNRLREHQKVQMGIDLYEVGLLFFKREFKVKQHFVLKY